METGEAASTLTLEDDKLKDMNLRECHLALRLDRDAFQFAIIENHDDYCLFIHHRFLPDDQSQVAAFKSALEGEPLLRSEYNSVSMAIAGDSALPVPSGVFEADKKKQLLTLHLGREIESVADVSVEMGGLQWVYEHSQELEKQLKSAFPNARMLANGAWMVQSMLRKSKWEKERLAYLDLSKSFFDLYIVQGGNLLFYNCFEVQSETDVLYHLMNTFQKLSIDPRDQKTLLSGQVDMGGATISLLKKYMKRVDLNFGMDFYRLSKGLSSAKKQYFVSLLNQYVCAS